MILFITYSCIVYIYNINTTAYLYINIISICTHYSAYTNICIQMDINTRI